MRELQTVPCRGCHKPAKKNTPCRWCGNLEHLRGFQLGPHRFGFDSEWRDGHMVEARWECSGGCDAQGRWGRVAKRTAGATWYQRSKAWWSWLAHVRRVEKGNAHDAAAKKLRQAS